MKRSNVIGILAAAAVIVLSVVLISWYLTKRTPTLIQGTVECTTYKASSKVPGRIDDMKVAQGDRVEKGQLLYTLSTPELEAKLRQAEAVKSAAAALDAMAAAIRWQRRPLPDILAALERYPLAGPYFHRITERMWEGQTLPQAWHSVFSGLSLGAEWMTALELTGDEEKLTNGLLYTAGQLKQLCRQRGEEQRQTAKLWLAGVLSAAGLLIILLI